VPKSRSRKPGGRVRPSRPVPVSALAHLGGGLFAVPPEISAGRLANLLASTDPSDPFLVTALPPYLLDAIASAQWLPYERCVDECMILAHAYAQFGIDAEVRAAELEITVRDTGATATYGSREPNWEDGMMHGHSVVWLPGPGHLVDNTAEQFAEIAAGTGPVIITNAQVPAPDRAPCTASPFQCSLRRDDVLLTYTVAPPAASNRMLDHPVVSEGASGYRRRGMNVASQTVILLAEFFSSEQIRLLPCIRAAALTEAIRDLPAEQIHNGDWRFISPGSNGPPRPARLDRLKLPDGIPPVARIGYSRSIDRARTDNASR